MDTDKNLLCVISFATQASDIPLYLKANTFHQELDEEEEEREKKKYSSGSMSNCTLHIIGMYTEYI